MRARGVILVTGSGGLLGRPICRRLARDYQVVGLDLHPPEGGEEPPEGVTWLAMDLTRDASVRQVLREIGERWGKRLASVVHLAAFHDFSGEPSPLYEDLTVKGTARLLRALRGFEVGQIVYSSSILAQRPVENGALVDESTPEHAEWAYPQSKLDAERVLRQERGDVPVVVLRIAGCYDEDGHSVPIGQQIRRIHERRLEGLVFPGNRQHGQAFVHVDDVAECVLAAVQRRAGLAPYEVFVVGEPAWLSYAELQDRIGESLHGREWPTVRIPAPVAKAGSWLGDKLRGDQFIKPWMIDLADAHYPVDIAKARAVLGWEPRHRLRDVLPVMLARLQADPARWYETNGLQPQPEAAAESGTRP